MNKIQINEKFGKLTVIECLGLIYNNTNTRRNYYKCKCECSNIITVSYTDLKAKDKRCCPDCSFKKRELRKENRTSQIEQMFNHDIILRCKHGNIKNNLSIDEYSKLIFKNCHYCNQKPSLVKRFKKNKYVNNEDIFTNGIDRKDSSKEYSFDNCVPCCSTCNKIKMDLSYEDFIEKIRLIYKNLKLSQT